MLSNTNPRTVHALLHVGSRPPRSKEIIGMLQWVARRLTNAFSPPVSSSKILLILPVPSRPRHTQTEEKVMSEKEAEDASVKVSSVEGCRLRRGVKDFELEFLLRLEGQDADVW